MLIEMKREVVPLSEKQAAAAVDPEENKSFWKCPRCNIRIEMTQDCNKCFKGLD